MVFVTGGSGLVGSHLILDLLRSGQEVRALCRPQSKLDRVRQLFHWYGAESGELYENIEWVNGDLTDIHSLDIAMDGAAAVYHCGALISFDPRDRSRLLKVNQEGTRNIVNLCLHKGVSRLYYTSSIATIGGTSGTVSEKDLWDPAHSNVYATSKYLAEMEVWRGEQEGLQTVLVNPGVILGPGFWSEGSGRIFSRLNSGLKIAPPGNTGFVGVWDVVRAMNALGASNYLNERFVLVAENLEYLELFQKIAVLLGVAPPKSALASWQLELLWRMDWVRSRIGGRKRNLSKSNARSLRLPVKYSSKKIMDRVAFQFQPLDEVLQECAENFREGSKMPQS
ncbi:MAG: NAD-dependent epimerase/dehydratase family protein [Bacteroidetes bacterium]|nr:MAG: NAD-dependent epimerase/dehydratase family protein [Bacteroidota bacterium]